MDEMLKQVWTRGLAEHFRAENGHDVDAILQTFAPDAAVVFGGKSYTGAEAIRRLHEGLGFGAAGAFSELRIVEIRRHHTEHAIVVEQRLRGRHTGVWEGVAASGRVIDVPACTVYELDGDGRITSERPYVDRWMLWEQIQGARARS
jgi:steroid delta-isomerase-like uncharacterized protein